MHSASEIKKKYNPCVTFSKNQIISKTLNMMNYPQKPFHSVSFPVQLLKKIIFLLSACV